MVNKLASRTILAENNSILTGIFLFRNINRSNIFLLIFGGVGVICYAFLLDTNYLYGG